MHPTQRKLIKEAYQAGYQEALDEGLGKLLAKSGKFLKNLFRGKRRGLINFGGELPEPNDANLFRQHADDLFNRLMKSLNTDVDNYYQDLGPTASDIVDKIGASIDDLFLRVQAGELTNQEAILKMMKRHPGFFSVDDFGIPPGSRFDDLPGLDP